MKKKNTLQVAVEAALIAGKILMNSYGKLKKGQIHTKSKNDFVTEIDKASEKAVIKTISSHFKGDQFLAEESGFTSGKNRIWIIDPLDGTSNYIHTFPQFCVSIAAMEDGQMVSGVVYDPLHKELFTAQKSKGAKLNGKSIHVSGVRKLSNALMATGIPFRARHRFKEYIASFEEISMGSVGLRRGGSAALDLSYVACGRFDGFWEIDLSPWDIAAGALLIKEAGGNISDMWGQPTYLQTGDVLGSNGYIQKELINITANTFSKIERNKLCP